MTVKIGGLAILCGTIFGLIATAPAQSEIVRVTYSGIVSDGFDYTGVFGAANTSLAGQSFIATYLFDDSVGYISNSPTIKSSEKYPLWAAGPSLGASLSIGGHMFSVSGDYYSRIGTYNAIDGGGSFQQISEIYDRGSNDLGQWNSYVYNNTVNYTTLFPTEFYGPYDGPTGSVNYGAFAAYSTQYALASPTNNAYGYLSADHLTIGLAGAPVPEPATWLMMILGFGNTGIAMRRRNRANANVRLA